jgi:hypothetical protein
VFDIHTPIQVGSVIFFSLPIEVLFPKLIITVMGERERERERE